MPEESRAVIIIFGGSGDLASRKLYPALFNLYRRGVLAEHFALLKTPSLAMMWIVTKQKPLPSISFIRVMM